MTSPFKFLNKIPYLYNIKLAIGARAQAYYSTARAAVASSGAMAGVIEAAVWCRLR